MARAKQSRPQPKKKKLQFPSGGSEQEETGGDDPSRSAAPRLGGRRAAPATAHGFLGSILGEAEAAAQQRVKKPHRFKPGTLRKYQKSTELLIPFTPFVRLVKELTEKSSTTVKRWTPPALVVLQEAAKYKLVDLLETANLCGIDAKRVGAEMFEPWNFKAQSEAHNPTDEEPGGQRKKLKRNETSNLEPKEHMPRLPSPSSCNPRAVESETSSTTAVPRRNPRVPGGNISAGQKSTQHARNNNKKSSRHVEDGTRTYRCEVKGCRSTFPGRSRLERHSRDVHRKGKLYKESELIMCSSCDKTFTRTEYLNNHVKRMHKPTPTFSCRLEGCTKIFDQHARKIHERSSQHFDGRTKKFKCTFKGCLFQTPLISSHNGHYMRFHKRGHEPTWTCRLEGCITELFDRHARMIHEKSSQHFDGRTKKFKCTFKGCMYQTPFVRYQILSGIIPVRTRVWEAKKDEAVMVTAGFYFGGDVSVLAV